MRTRAEVDAELRKVLCDLVSKPHLFKAFNESLANAIWSLMLEPVSEPVFLDDKALDLENNDLTGENLSLRADKDALIREVSRLNKAVAEYEMTHPPKGSMVTPKEEWDRMELKRRTNEELFEKWMAHCERLVEVINLMRDVASGWYHGGYGATESRKLSSALVEIAGLTLREPPPRPELETDVPF